MSCPILNLFTKCSYCGWIICQFCMQLTIVVIAIAFGGLIAWKPKKVIRTKLGAIAKMRFILTPKNQGSMGL